MGKTRVTIAGIMAVHYGMPTLPLALHSLRKFDEIIIHYTKCGDGGEEWLDFICSVTRNMRIKRVGKVKSFSELHNAMIEEATTTHWFRNDSDVIVHPDIYDYLKKEWTKNPDSIACTYWAKMLDEDTYQMTMRTMGAPRYTVYPKHKVHECLILGDKRYSGTRTKRIVQAEGEGKAFRVPRFISIHWGSSHLEFNLPHWKRNTEKYHSLGGSSIYKKFHAKSFDDFVEKLKNRKGVTIDRLSKSKKNWIFPPKWRPKDFLR